MRLGVDAVLHARVSDGALERLREAVDRTRMLVRGRPLTGHTHDDADHEVGSIATDSARDFGPFPLLRALHAAGTRVVIIGQVAGILHGSSELTGDLDLLWDGDPAQAAALTRGFAAVGCWLLAAGCWLLAAGCWLLAAGCWARIANPWR